MSVVVRNLISSALPVRGLIPSVILACSWSRNWSQVVPGCRPIPSEVINPASSTTYNYVAVPTILIVTNLALPDPRLRTGACRLEITS